MGLIRKTMSVSTLGAINYRSGSERQAAAVRKQASATRALARAQEAQAAGEQADRDREAALRREAIEIAEREARARALHNYHMWLQTEPGRAYEAWNERQQAVCQEIRQIDDTIQEAWRADCRDAVAAFPYPFEPSSLKKPATVTDVMTRWAIAAAILGFVVHVASGRAVIGLAALVLAVAIAARFAVPRARQAAQTYAQRQTLITDVRAHRSKLIGAAWQDSSAHQPPAWLERWGNWRGATEWLAEIDRVAKTGDYPSARTLGNITISVLPASQTYGGPRTVAALQAARSANPAT